MMVNLAAALENEGISVFRFDFSGNGYVHNALGIHVFVTTGD